MAKDTPKTYYESDAAEEFIVLLEEQEKPKRGKVLSVVFNQDNHQQQGRPLLLCTRTLLLSLLTLLLLKVSMIIYFQRHNEQLQDETDNSLLVESDPNNNEKDQDKEIHYDSMELAFGIAQRRFQARWTNENKLLGSNTNSSTIATVGYHNLMDYPIQPTHPTQPHKVINSIRIPKSGSSSLSVTARALAGCHPDGFPCCTFPGDPVGSCPRHNLTCPGVTGCGGHRPSFAGNEPIITNIRQPAARLLSGFFYLPPHRPVMEMGHSWEVFQQDYIQDPVYQNVLTKMLSGYYAYDPFNETIHTLEQAMTNACRMAWFGMVESPVLSALMLYETTEFSMLIPNPVTFGLPPVTTTEDFDNKNNVSDTNNDNDLNNNFLRVDNDEEYGLFKRKTFVERNGESLVQKFNAQDVQLYGLLQLLFCARVYSVQGLVADTQAARLATTELDRCQQLLFESLPTSSMARDAKNEKNQARISTEDLCPCKRVVP